MSSATLPDLASMVGTTTRVRHSGGIPSEKSMRGSARGVASNVTAQFTRATAIWLAATINKTAIGPSVQISARLPWALTSRHPANVRVLKTIPPT